MKLFHSKIMGMRLVALFSLLITVFAFSSFFVSATAAETVKDPTTDLIVYDGTFDWDTTLDVKTSSSLYINYSDFRENYCVLASTASQCASAANGKYIRFDTAEDLYRWSMDVSFEDVYISSTPSENVKLAEDKIAVLLSLNYVLGGDIDYSVMGAKTFVPIGYWFADTQSNVYQNIFTGTFDGQGFEISNLYVAGYDYLVYVEQIDALNTIDIALSSYYSMFPFNAGTIQNLGLINPTFELLNLHIDIDKVSNIVGLNLSQGLVDHVYVIDNRTDVTEAGIRYKVGTSSEVFEAAGLVHTNQGTFTNSYYVSKVVVNGSYINKFNIQPVLFLNQGTISNLVYDSSVYLLSVTVGTSTFIIDTPNAYAAGEATSLLKSSSSSLNSATDRWYFYENDRYPYLLGLDYNESDQAYHIDNAIDLVFFSRALAYLTQRSGVSFAYDDYMLTTDIDMSTLAPDTYQTPEVTFYGSFTGENPAATDLSENYYIYNLNIHYGTIRGTGYYAGLFSILGANSDVHDFNMGQSTIALEDTEGYYSSIFYVGSVAGRVSAGSISDIIVDVDLDLGTQAIGKTYLGGVVGEASGIVTRVSSYGTIDMNNHTYQLSYNVNPKFYIGGIVGGADLLQLKLSEAVNYGDIHGFGTTSTFSFVTGVTSIESKVGGVIGYILNTSTIRHQVVSVANHGDFYLDTTVNTAGLPSTKYVGGVFGELRGYAPVLEENDVYAFAKLYNDGTIHAYYASSSSLIRAAGIGISNTSQAVEYAMLFNHGTFDYDASGASYSNPYFRYTATIYDVSSYGVTLSRAYNWGDLNYGSSYFVTISPFYYSLNNNTTTIRYSANYGDVNYMASAGSSQITMPTNLVISGITTSSNVDFQNVIHAGDINVVNLNLGTYSMSISGFTTTLASGRVIENSLNQGNIYFGQIAGSGNIYVGGIVVSNLSGDLHESWQSETQPIATLGIINTINYGKISTSYGLVSQNLYAVDGTSNTFVGGIASLNAGSIQDSANLGNISVYNSSTSGVANFQTDSYYAGLVGSYTAGVVAGGVVAATISGNARVYDTGNNGDITAVSYRFARAGGVLGVSLYAEATAGGITAGMGLVNTIENSILSNGLNFGNIAAITYDYGTYTTSSSTQNFQIYYGSGSTGGYYYEQTTSGTQERPEINAAAGGVIGYGLSIMRRMLNHGTISSTDVAGGIVGATYVLGGSTSPVTVTHIRTAINYGDIKAVRANEYASIDKFALSYSDYSTHFYPDGDSFIFPSGYTRTMPRGKRGFGGIFGRLQRGLNGIMTSEGGEFDFIINANPNIDLIGRLDQVYNFSSSSRFFRFNNAIYYSAKVNDTTQVVFTGFYYVYARITVRSGSNPYTYTATASRLYQQVGNVGTLLEYTSFTMYFQTTYRYSTGTYVYVYYQPIDVPWITENPAETSNPSEEYMYDENFPMRTDPDLTQYIYYMDYDLLASRFQTGGSNPRVNGMYVLSTSAGSTFGSVLPSNINISEIGLIDEDYPSDIPLSIDYDHISVMYQDSLDAAVIANYETLRQTTFNEKSNLIESDSTMVILSENGGSETYLSDGTVDYDNHIITYTISMEAFLDGQTSASYSVYSALTSAYALIGERPDDYYGHSPSAAELLAYRALLYPERNDSISTSYPADLVVTLPSKSITSNTTLTLGYFTIFSEAFVGDDLFAQTQYYTNYRVDIVFTPTIDNISTGTIGIVSASFNGGSNVAVANPADIRSLGTVNYNGSLTLNFQDTKGILTYNYDFKDYFVLKYSDGSVVPSTYYSVTSTPVTIVSGTGYYSITFTFLSGTKQGTYSFDYRYFPTSSLLNVLWTKGASNQAAISTFSYYSSNGSLSIIGTSMTSSVNFGTIINMSSPPNVTETTLSVASYLSNKTYNVTYMNANSLVISPFATLTSATLIGVSYLDGYKTYEIQYVVTAEDGTQVTYTHLMTERPVDLVAALKNGNEIDLNDVFTVREATSTNFSVDLGLDESLGLYTLTSGSNDYITVAVSGTHLDGVTAYLPAEIVGLSYSASDLLHIIMSFDTEPGIYTFTFTIVRGTSGNSVTIATPLVITKQAGTDSFLNDIRFSDLANETEYPDIFITDQNGTILDGTGYVPGVYFGGIDYDDADIAGYRYYRVDGAVANTPLDEYAPYML
ncbi:MAG: hypothetical protein PHP32_02930, partial [Candidatus Izemoplasmatales bacterium]|nr:hypothetical protein [Candidatus Izemoplasmatales bacterium]